MQDIQFPLEFLIEGTPLSLGASGRSREAWKERVKSASYAGLPEQHVVFSGPIEIDIFHFPATDMVGDIDNIVKPILDSLCNHIYFDDRQVARVLVQKFEPGQPSAFVDPSQTLTLALASNRPITYIRLSNDPYGMKI